MIEDLKKNVSAKLAEAQVPVLAIDGRIKRLFSIHQKLKRQKIDLDQVYDLVALRIVTAVGEGLLRGARHHPSDVVAGAGAHQGLHRDAAAERLSIAAHVGRQRARVPVRSPDPHARDAQDGGRGHRRALEVQGRTRRRRPRRAALPLAAAAARVAAGGARSAGVPAEPEDRALRGRGLHLHAERRSEGAAARRDPDRLRVLHPHRRRPSVRRRARQRQDGAAAHAAPQRRHRRDRHDARAQAEPRLAEHRRDVAGAEQDQALHPHRREGQEHTSSDASCSRRKRAASA